MKKLFLFISIILFTFACGDDDPITEVFPNEDSFSRAEMLEFWADEIIIPAYTNYISDLDILKESSTAFFTDPSEPNFNTFRDSYILAYTSWQQVSMFEIGKAEEIGLRNFTNIYPTNVDLIESNINNQNFDLALPSNFVAQGFPALDYLLFGKGDDDEVIVQALTSANVTTYVEALIDRLNDLSTEVLDDWNGGFRDEFVSNDGSSATASTDKLVNDFLFYYERFLRAAKVGIPAGVFSGNTEPDRVEGLFSDIYSKLFFEAGFSSAQDFFNGISFIDGREGVSLKQYLEEIQLTNNSDFDIAASINDNWQSAELVLIDINANFRNQVLEDNAEMLALYDELQKAVVSLKVDMLQALNIQVDFVDADGD